jgi:hypothetical protein
LNETDKVEFDLIYEFILGDGEEQTVSFTSQRIQIVARGVVLNTQSASGIKVRSLESAKISQPWA